MNFRLYHVIVLVSAVVLFGTALMSFLKPQWLGISEKTPDAVRVNKVQSTNPEKRQQNALYNQGQHAGHDHDDHSDKGHEAERKNKVYSVGIPKEINDEIEKKRIPKSQLVTVEVKPGVFITDLKGQYEHVSVAVRQPDGTIKIVEKQIMPLEDDEVDKE